MANITQHQHLHAPNPVAIRYPEYTICSPDSHNATPYPTSAWQQICWSRLVVAYGERFTQVLHNQPLFGTFFHITWIEYSSL